MRFYPQGLGYGKEIAEGAELARQKDPRKIRNGPLRWPQQLPAGAVLPPLPPGYVTPEELRARMQQRNEDQDDPSWGTVEDLKTEPEASDIGDITPF